MRKRGFYNDKKKIIKAINVVFLIVLLALAVCCLYAMVSGSGFEEGIGFVASGLGIPLSLLWAFFLGVTGEEKPSQKTER